MNEVILISGAGAPAAIGVIKSLKKSNFQGRIIALDANPLSAGFYLCDKGYVVPKLSDPKHWDSIQKIIREESVTLILPTSGFDIQAFSKHKKELHEQGIKVFMSNSEAMETCLDKLKFFQALQDEVPIPKTSTDPSTLQFPVIAKPRRGKGSVGIYKCETEKDVNKDDVDYIYQEYLPGKEITVDCIFSKEGEMVLSVPRIRVETKAGISFKGKIFHDNEIDKVCEIAGKKIGLEGPVCMQLKQNAQGTYEFLEINPRLGGATFFVTLAGVNIPDICIKLSNNEECDIPNYEDITVLRYYEEVIADERFN